MVIKASDLSRPAGTVHTIHRTFIELVLNYFLQVKDHYFDAAENFLLEGDGWSLGPFYC